MNNDNIIKLYRAIDAEEFASVFKTKRFSLHERKSSVKYFAFNFEETLEFANKSFNNELVAILEVKIYNENLNNVGDFVNVDPFCFKSGTVEIQLENLEKFNACILEINHII